MEMHTNNDITFQIEMLEKLKKKKIWQEYKGKLKL